MRIYEFILCILSLLLTSSSPLQANEQGRVERAGRAIEKAREYLGRTPPAEVGSLYLKIMLTPAKVADKDIPYDDAYRRLFGVKYTPKDFSIVRRKDISTSDDIHALLEKNNFKLKNYFYTINSSYKKAYLDPWDDMLIKALYCDIAGYDDTDWEILYRLRDKKGDYYDTHQLLALLMLEENGCYDQAKVAEAKRLVVNDIVAAQHKSAQNPQTAFDDLFAERLACIYWARASEQVVPTWIDIVLDAQRDDGGWPPLNRLEQSGTHPSGLAAIALRYFIEQGSRPTKFYQR